MSNGRILIVALLSFIAVSLFNSLSDVNDTPNYNTEEYSKQLKIINDVSYSDFINLVENQKMLSAIVEINGNVVGTDIDGNKYKTQTLPFQSERIMEKMERNNVDITIKEHIPNSSFGIGSIFSLIIPLLMLYFMYKIFKTSQMSEVMSNKPAIFSKENNVENITLEDVAGIEEAKQDLMDILDYIKNPEKYKTIGAEPLKGSLLIGPPGVGKTLIAKAIANEAEVPFISIDASSVIQMFVGLGAKRIKDSFETAANIAVKSGTGKCIIFIDEIDSIGGSRTNPMSHNENRQTLTQLLSCMNGFTDRPDIDLFTIGATNTPETLDPALLRRFDRKVYFSLPDLNSREKIFKVHTKKKMIGPDVNLRKLAIGTPGFSGSDIKQLCNEASFISVKNGRAMISQEDFELAKDKTMLGDEKSSLILSDDEKRLTAYHEAGHALCALKQKDSDPIYKATIIPRGRALGVVMRLPEKDKVSMSFAQLKADLIVAFGGRAAEELIFGKDYITTGASSDIQQATNIATRMITEWGYSDKLGTVLYNHNQGSQYLGGNSSSRQNVSEETSKLIDEEIRNLVNESNEKAKELLKENIDELHKLANALIEKETLTLEEIKEAIKN